MKKFLPIIIGVLVGIAASGAMISHVENRVAHGGVDCFEGADECFAELGTLNWSDVFSDTLGEPGSGLYMLVFGRLNYVAEDKALEEIGRSYGMTSKEAQEVVGGSIRPIFNNPDRGSALLNQEDAYAVMESMQEEYALLYEMLQIEQELNVAVSPSEIFSNGDLSDSGFDLVHDLSVIEEILFLDVTPSSVGAPFEDAPATPYGPVVRGDVFSGYVTSSAPVATLPLEVSEDGESGIVNIGDSEVAVEILGEDVCPVDSPLADALDDFAAAAPDAGDDADDTPGAATGDDATDDEEADSPAPSGGDEPIAAPKGQWGSVWCPGSPNAIPPDDGNFNLSQLESLGGVPGPFALGAADGSDETLGFSADVGLCFDIQLIKESLSSYQPGSSCIDCEIELIIKHLEDMLRHSLVPNKATGNLMESAKCKQAVSDPLIGIEFITIWNPIPTPANEDLVLTKNIFQEWNTFVENFQPIVPFTNITYPQYDSSFQVQYQQKISPAGTAQSEVFSSLNQLRATYQSDALLDLETKDESNDVTNIGLYSKNVLEEMRQMNSFFKAYIEKYKEIEEKAMQELIKKPDRG